MPQKAALKKDDSLYCQNGSIGYWAARLFGAMNLALERRLQTSGITARQFAALVAIEAGAKSPGELAQQLGVDAAAATRLLDRLADAGLIERSTKETDRRCVEIKMTDKGVALFPTLVPLAQSVDVDLVKGLGPKDRAAFLKHLQELSAKAATLH